MSALLPSQLPRGTGCGAGRAADFWGGTQVLGLHHEVLWKRGSSGGTKDAGGSAHLSPGHLFGVFCYATGYFLVLFLEESSVG